MQGKIQIELYYYYSYFVEFVSYMQYFVFNCNATSLIWPFPSRAFNCNTETEHNLGFDYGQYIHHKDD